MHHIIGLSGGKDSTALALRLAEVEPRAYTYLCTPTGNEPAARVAHWATLERLLGPIVRLQSHTLESLIEEQQCLPSHRMRWCTRRLKIAPTLAYLRTHAPATLYVGLRADEDTREGLYGTEVPCDFPLRRWGWTEVDVLDYLHQRGVTIPARTDCEWCYDQTLAEWRNLWRDQPDSWARACAWEAQTGHTFRSPQRDTQPAPLVFLGAKFAAGFMPRGDSDQLSLFEAPELRKCRICTL
jgi:hypothetical protein